MLPPRSVLVVFASLATIWACVFLLRADAPLAFAFDDSFYYFEIAQRFSEGQGSTFDGIHATNGYHPLWMWVASGVYLAGLRGDLAVRLLLLLQLVMVFGGAALAVGGVRWPSHRAPTLFAALILGTWLAIPPILRTQLNGMESAVVVLVHGALLALVQRHGVDRAADWPLRVRLAVGLLLGTSILARTDGALLTPLLLLAVAPGALSRPFRLLPVFVPPALTLLSFLLANLLLFDTPLQVSGTLKRVPPGLGGWAILCVCGAVALVLLWLGRRGLSQDWPVSSLVLRNTAWYGCFTLAVVAYYMGMQSFARAWYFAPIVLWTTVLLAGGALDLAARALSEKPGSTDLAALAPLAALLMLPQLGAAAYGGYGLVQADTLAVRWADRDAARWLNENLPEGTLVASWDAGLIGYNTSLPIVNLDGVVNDKGWLDAMRAGTAGARLRAEGITWFVNHSDYADGRCTTLDDALHRLDPTLPRTTVVKTWQFEQFGAINGGLPTRHMMATCVLQFE